MSWFILKRDVLKDFDKANLDLFNCDLHDLDNDFGYLFLTFLLFIYGID